MTAHDGTTGAPLFVLEGTTLENQFGRAVCGLGDLDQDGIGDFAVGVPHDDGLVSNGGRVLVYRGAVTSDCGLQLVGSPSTGNSAALRMLGPPSTAGLLLTDATSGPTAIPPYGFLQLGLTPALTPLIDTLGVFGPPTGSTLDTQGLLVAGPWTVPGFWAGITIYAQAFVIDAQAPNGVFQASDGLAITFLP
ncbi:MAG: hypothetical protein CMJ83_07280 [Planctomycetes bacterium]|nr:hypothetical protein [Planctomycetota bacterium]